MHLRCGRIFNYCCARNLLLCLLMKELKTRNVGQCPTWCLPCRIYMWHPLFNATKFGWRPLLQCRAVMLPRCETRLNLPKLSDRSQPLVGRSSLYCRDMWRRYCCLTSFFPIGDMYLSCEYIARQSCAMDKFVRSKLALEPHHVLKYGRHPISDRWD